MGSAEHTWGKQYSCWISGTDPPGKERERSNRSFQEKGHGEAEGDPGSTTTRCLEILSLQRRSVLQNNPPIPSCSRFIPAGHPCTDLPSRETIPSRAGQTLSHCLSQVLIPGSDPYFYYWCWASRGKQIFGPHTKGFGSFVTHRRADIYLKAPLVMLLGNF